ncbi:MAG: formyl-CoA transferase [Candidatus Rokuibacteriota bacterium]|nr:MAG: formyl-CoA transferase [Candidatus Rokubacteria bacterium]
MLHGIRVLDLSRVIAGPYCAALLGDLGADVIKLERPGRGDDLRALRGSGRMSASFAAVNRNKRGIAVDLQKPEGSRLAFELARGADVLIENFLPGVAERLGLGYPAVRAANPPIVYASITGFGQTGPLAKKPGYNTIAQGMSGLMALTGMPGHPPTRVGGSVSDVAASYVAFGMINAALVHRFPPAEAFQTKDGLLNVVLMNPEQWGRFCAALDDAAMETDPRFATNEARLANHAAFKARVERILAAAPADEWVTRLEAAGIAAGPVYEFHEVFEDPQVRYLELVTAMDQPGKGSVRFLGFPGRASGTPPRIDRPAPLLGQHTAEVLGELGLSREEIERLAAASVVALGDGG